MGTPIDRYYYNFLSNISMYSYFMHMVIQQEHLNDIMQVPIAQYLSKSFNFPNIHDIENAFYPIFNGSMFDCIANYEIPQVIIRTKEYKKIIKKMNDNWKELIEGIFEERHKFVHDANYIKMVNMSTDFIRDSEVVFITFPQIFTLWISKEYNLIHSTICMNMDDKTITVSNVNTTSIPFIFLPEDLGVLIKYYFSNATNV